ncbi:MAG: hypothetical protein H8E44_21215 [Planctomycetes bacterium]|nr:hypothetical protein [Planctomycetota bacterium]
MDRRTFLRTSAGAAVPGIIGGVVSASQAGQTARPRSDAPAVLRGYTVEDQRRRVEENRRWHRGDPSGMGQAPVSG